MDRDDGAALLTKEQPTDPAKEEAPQPRRSNLKPRQARQLPPAPIEEKARPGFSL